MLSSLEALTDIRMAMTADDHAVQINRILRGPSAGAANIRIHRTRPIAQLRTAAHDSHARHRPSAPSRKRSPVRVARHRPRDRVGLIGRPQLGESEAPGASVPENMGARWRCRKGARDSAAG